MICEKFEFCIFMYLFAVLLLRIAVRFININKRAIESSLFIIPPILASTLVYFLNININSEFLNYNEIRFSLLVAALFLAVLSLLRGLSRDSIFNFITSLNFGFMVIAIGSTNLISLFLSLLMVIILSVIHVGASYKLEMIEFSVRLLYNSLLTVVIMFFIGMSYIIGNGSILLEASTNSNNIFLLFALFLAVILVLVEGGGFVFSFIITDIGNKAGANIYPILLNYKFILISMCLVFINDLSNQLNYLYHFVDIVRLLASICIGIVIISSFKLRNSSAIIARIYGVHIVLLISVFCVARDVAILSNALNIFVLISAATAVCLDRHTIVYDDVASIESLPNLITFAVCISLMGILPFSSLFIKRLTLFISINQYQLDILSILFILSLMILFIQSSNLVLNRSKCVRNNVAKINFAKLMLEWCVVVIILFGGAII